MGKSAVLDFLAKEFGGEVEYADETKTVGTTAAEVAGGDGERPALLFINLSANTIYVAPTPSVSTTRGIYLGANGGSVSMVVRDDLILPALQWHAVASAAGSSLYVIRVRRFRGNAR